MRIFVVGGSGLLGTLVLPLLAQGHEVVAYGRNAPKVAVDRYVAGDVRDPEPMWRGMRGCDALIYMAMGSQDWGSASSVESAFDVNGKGLYWALEGVHRESLDVAVYTSSMSVYYNYGARFFPDEDLPPDARDVYGFTKRLGEEVCRNCAQNWGINVNVLRICQPVPDEQLEVGGSELLPVATAASDLAAAIGSALEHRAGYDVFMVSGDRDGVIMDMGRAARRLNWIPRAASGNPGGTSR